MSEAGRPAVAVWELAGLAGAVLAGLVARLWLLPQVPGLWYDEAINGLDALTILRERLPIFFDTFGHMREPLYMYLNAAFVALLGTSAEAIRGTSVAVGVLTIPAVWALAREWHGPATALAAAWVFALLRWHVHFSCLAFRTILAPLVAALMFLFLLRLLRTGRWQDAALCGAFLGLGAYTYLAFRLVPLMLLPPLILASVKTEDRRTWWRNVAILVGTGAVVFAPLGVDYLRNPEHFRGRAGEVTLLERENPAGLLLRQSRDVALMPLFRGDHVPKHNVPGPPRFLQGIAGDPGSVTEAWDLERSVARSTGQPAPDPHGTGVPVVLFTTGLLFFLGLGLMAARARREAGALALFSWVLVGSLASILSFGAPNMLRLLILTPVFVLAIVEGGWFLYRRLAGWNRGAAIGLLAVLGAAHLANEGYTLAWWTNHPMAVRDFNTEWRVVGDYLRAQPDRVPVRLAEGFRLGNGSFPPTLTYLADGYRWNPAREELGERWWEFRTQPPFPALEPLGAPLEGGRRLEVMHPVGIGMGALVEVAPREPGEAPDRGL